MRGSQLTAYISVALLLLIIGIIALTGITAQKVTDSIRSNVGFVAMIDDKNHPESALQFDSIMRSMPWTATITYTDADAVLVRWKKLMDDEFDDIIDINPFLPEYEICVHPQWTSADSIMAITERIRGIDCVYDVKAHTEMVSVMNHTVKSIILTLILLAAILFLIAVVLVHNMIRLEIYAQRHIINTMKYVGATNGFIRRPYIFNAMAGGAMAGGVAALILVGLTLYAGTFHSAIAEALSWPWLITVSSGLILTGSALCSFFAFLATSKYLRKKHDELFN